MVKVMHNGAAHEFDTLALAKQFMALNGHAGASKSVATGPATTWSPEGTVIDRSGRGWAAESDGVCNRCSGIGFWSGMQDRACYRCNRTGRAPGFAEAQVVRDERNIVVGLLQAQLDTMSTRECENRFNAIVAGVDSDDRLAVEIELAYFTPAQELEYQSLMAKVRLGSRQAARLAQLEALIP